MKDLEYMHLAIVQAQAAALRGEVPVGAIVRGRIRRVRLVPPRVAELDELALLGRRATRLMPEHHDLRVHDHVLVNDAKLAVVLLDQILEGRTDPLAVGSSKVPGFY